MILTREIPKNKTYDLCIIGSGPAGMTVLNELRDSGLTIIMIESGGLKTSPQTDALRKTESRGILIKEYSRERVLGGTSSTWAGLSSPLDPIDFDSVPYRESAWPFGRTELLPYYERASRDYGFAALSRFEIIASERMRANDDIQPIWKNLSEKLFIARSPAQQFGKQFRRLFQIANIDLLLNTTVSEILIDADAKNTTGVQAVCAAGSTCVINARHIVCAAGGIENARLLLASKSRFPSGIGNTHDQVGRYLMNHPKNCHGVIHLNAQVRTLPYFFGSLSDGFASYAGLRLKEHIQKEQKLLNAYVRFEPLFPWSNKDGVAAFITLIKKAKVIFFLWAKRKHTSELKDYAETGDDSDLQNTPLTLRRLGQFIVLLCRDILPLSQYIYARLNPTYRPPIYRIRLRNFMEMEPRSENRVTLGVERNFFGQPVAKVAHAPSALDKRSLIRLHQVLDQELRGLSIGHLESNPEKCTEWPIMGDASHHMGTTRMGRDPKKSVVDEHCKVHGTENLYMAGASVFSTSGCANPTYTIVALSIRLADHLKEEFGVQETR